MNATITDIPVPVGSPAATAAATPADVTSYLAIHRAMRTANEQLVAGLVRSAAYDPERVAALARWFAGYAAELRTHHHIEDDLIFPALAARSQTFARLAPTLDVDHHRLDNIIDTLAGVLTRWAGVLDPRAVATFREDAIFFAVQLRDLLASHLDVEDTVVIPLIQETFSAAEYAEFDKAAGKAISLKHALWTVPWIVATLDEATLEKMWAEAPAILKLVNLIGTRGYARLAAAAFAPARDGVADTVAAGLNGVRS